MEQKNKHELLPFIIVMTLSIMIIVCSEIRNKFYIFSEENSVTSYGIVDRITRGGISRANSGRTYLFYKYYYDGVYYSERAEIPRALKNSFQPGDTVDIIISRVKPNWSRLIENW